jgi:2',3'-cyclic-nucleotide 2'-phosphodiesterase (5'-nucleotidase family)
MTAKAYFISSPKAVQALLLPQERAIKPGKFSEDELYWTFPFEDTLCSIELSDEDFKTIKEEIAKLKDGTRLEITMNDNLSLPAGRKTTVLSSYLLAGAGGRIKSLANFAKNPECHAADTGITLRDAFRSYLKKGFSK